LYGCADDPLLAARLSLSKQQALDLAMTAVEKSVQSRTASKLNFQRLHLVESGCSDHRNQRHIAYGQATGGHVGFREGSSESRRSAEGLQPPYRTSPAPRFSHCQSALSMPQRWCSKVLFVTNLNLLRQQLGNHAAQPAAAGVVVVALMPVLLDAVVRQGEGHREHTQRPASLQRIA
jgi:hypothetical protein